MTTQQHFEGQIINCFLQNSDKEFISFLFLLFDTIIVISCRYFLSLRTSINNSHYELLRVAPLDRHFVSNNVQNLIINDK